MRADAAIAHNSFLRPEICLASAEFHRRVIHAQRSSEITSADFQTGQRSLSCKPGLREIPADPVQNHVYVRDAGHSGLRDGKSQSLRERQRTLESCLPLDGDGEITRVNG